MDIFTTVLTRVVPVPIKPANLKVKALLKEASTGGLKEDLDHLENHEYYFFDNQKHQENKAEKQHNSQADSSVESSEKKADDGISVDKDGTKHLDIYV